MTAVTLLTEEVARDLEIADDWRIQQIAVGQNVCILTKDLFTGGRHINPYMASDVMPQVATKNYSGPTLFVRGDRVNTIPLSEIEVREGSTEPLVYTAPKYVIVYTVHKPQDVKMQEHRKLSWLYVSRGVNMAKLKEDYTKIFHS